MEEKRGKKEKGSPLKSIAHCHVVVEDAGAGAGCGAVAGAA